MTEPWEADPDAWKGDKPECGFGIIRLYIDPTAVTQAARPLPSVPPGAGRA